MWKKWLAFSGLLGLIVLLDPTHTPAQPGKGGFGKGGFGQPPSGGTGASAPGGFGQPGGFGRDRGTGGFGAQATPAPGTSVTPTAAPAPGGFGQPGGFGRDRGSGGPPAPGGFGGPPGGGSRGIDPERGWSMLQKLTNSTGDTVDLGQIPPQTRDWLRGAAEKSGGLPLPESGIMTKAAYFDHNARSEAARASAAPPPGSSDRDRGSDRGPGGDRGRGFGGDPNGGFGGPGGFGGGGDQRPGEKKETEEERPVAMRYGKLPKDLPSWFEQDDTDKDGQIGLYEWRKASKDMKEFTDMDLNSDGFVTADEYLRFARQRNIDTKIANYEETGTRPAAWGIGPVVPGSGGDTKGKSGWGPPSGKPDSGKPDSSKPDSGKPDRDKDKSKSGNPWSKGK